MIFLIKPLVLRSSEIRLFQVKLRFYMSFFTSFTRAKLSNFFKWVLGIIRYELAFGNLFCLLLYIADIWLLARKMI